jgi:LacI family transcriptional regulator, gluconate utilization system Gnt-I transcriptional repressor
VISRLINNPTRPVRVEDVARVAGVSPITVSRALSQPHKVRDETRQRVTEAVAQTGYVVNSFASSLRSGRSSVVTVFVSSLTNPYYANSMQGVIDAFENSSYHLMFAQTGYSEMLEIDVVNSMLPFRPAGVVFTGVVRSEETRAALQRLGTPVMEMWGYRPDPIDMLVGFSNADGARLMGEHFGQRGFRHIAYSGHTTERGAERIAGFREGLAKFGATLSLVLPMEGTRNIPDGIAAFTEIMARLPDCDAVLFGTDILAAGALLGARKLGIDVPQQVAIAGFGDLDFAPHLVPPLTTVQVASYDLGLEAGRMLLRRLNDEPVADPVRLMPVTLQVRESTQG